MNDRLDDLGRDAADALRTSTSGHGPGRLDDGLDEVVRRGRRSRVVRPVLAAVVVVAVAVPAVAWFLDSTEPTGVEVADAPDEQTDEPVEQDPDDPEPVVDPGDAETESDAPASEDEVDDEGAEGEETTSTEGERSGPDPLGEFSLDAVETEGFPAGGQDVISLVDVRVAGQEGFDRIVLEFEGDGMSPYRVGYVDPPVLQDGSGNEVDIPGEAFLELRLTAASGVTFDTDSDEGFELTYDGPERVTADGALITEAVRTGDFEATLTWTVGLEERAPFSVTVLESPLRLVVDVRTP